MMMSKIPTCSIFMEYSTKTACRLGDIGGLGLVNYNEKWASWAPFDLTHIHKWNKKKQGKQNAK